MLDGADSVKDVNRYSDQGSLVSESGMSVPQMSEPSPLLPGTSRTPQIMTLTGEIEQLRLDGEDGYKWFFNNIFAKTLPGELSNNISKDIDNQNYYTFRPDPSNNNNFQIVVTKEDYLQMQNDVQRYGPNYYFVEDISPAENKLLYLGVEITNFTYDKKTDTIYIKDSDYQQVKDSLTPDIVAKLVVNNTGQPPKPFT